VKETRSSRVMSLNGSGFFLFQQPIHPAFSGLHLSSALKKIPLCAPISFSNVSSTVEEFLLRKSKPSTNLLHKKTKQETVFLTFVRDYLTLFVFPLELSAISCRPIDAALSSLCPSLGASRPQITLDFLESDERVDYRSSREF
jgi:hypothetical protein